MVVYCCLRVGFGCGLVSLCWLVDGLIVLVLIALTLVCGFACCFGLVFCFVCVLLFVYLCVVVYFFWVVLNL